MDRRAVRGPIKQGRSLVNGTLTRDEFLFTTPGRIFITLRKHPYGATTNDLIDAVYGDRADGGPDDAPHCIYVFLVQMRRWLAKHYPLLKHHVITGRRHILVIRR